MYIYRRMKPSYMYKYIRIYVYANIHTCEARSGLHIYI